MSICDLCVLIVVNGFMEETNPDEQSNELDLAGLTAQKALEVTEKRLAYFLSAGKLDKPLVVTVPKAPKGRPIKLKLHAAMKECVSVFISSPSH